MYKFRGTTMNIIEQSLEVLGYTTQYAYLYAAKVIHGYAKQASLVFEYLKLCLYDKIDYYHIFLILSLPASLFGAPVLRIQQAVQTACDSDDDENATIQKYDLFITHLEFIFKSNEVPPTMTRRTMNGAQLQPLIDKKGRFFIGHIHKYYPNLDTIFIRYLKTPSDHNSHKKDTICVKIIDVAKRYDIRNNASCKFGVYL